VDRRGEEGAKEKEREEERGDDFARIEIIKMSAPMRVLVCLCGLDTFVSFASVYDRRQLRRDRGPKGNAFPIHGTIVNLI